VDCIEVFIHRPIQQETAFRFGDLQTTLTKAEISHHPPIHIAADLQEIFVVSKFMTAHDVVKLFSRPMGFCVTRISRVAGANWRKRGTIPMEKRHDFIP
jgi:hypothetical protein